MLDPVFDDERSDRGSKRLPEEVHRIVRMNPDGLCNRIGSERLVIVPGNVTGELIGTGQV
jgi:hypothetical protein